MAMVIADSDRKSLGSGTVDQKFFLRVLPEDNAITLS